MKLLVVQFDSLLSGACPIDPSALSFLPFPTPNISSRSPRKKRKTSPPEALEGGSGHSVFLTSYYVDTMDTKCLFLGSFVSLLEISSQNPSNVPLFQFPGSQYLAPIPCYQS